MTLQAISYKIIVKPDELEKEVTTASGLVIAQLDSDEQKKGANIRGTVVDIGEDAFAAYKPKTEFAGLKVGDVVYYAKYAGKRIKESDEGEEFVVLVDDDIVCKVKKEAE